MRTGNEILEQARDAISRGLRYEAPTCRADDDNPTHFDCSGFVAWVVHRMDGASVGPVSNTGYQYRFCRDSDQRPISLDDGLRTAGALLFRNPEGGPRPHVAISVGDGDTTLEAMGSNYNPNGVRQASGARDRGWTHAVLVPGIDYGTVSHDADCVLDTAPGRMLGYTGSKPTAGMTVPVDVLGAGAAAGVTGVMLNVTARKATADGFVTVFPSGTARPTASNLNLDKPGRDTSTALVTVPVGADGRVSVYTQSGAHLLAHRARVFVEGQGFNALAPTRLRDTRADGAPLAADSTIEVQILGAGGVPAEGVSAAVLTVTGVDAPAPGYVTVWPSGSPRPTASNLNLDSAAPRANQVIVPVGTNGRVSLYTQAGAHLLVDVSGWFATASVFNALPPVRIFDTRSDTLVNFQGERPRPAGMAPCKVLGMGGVPGSGVHEVVLNVTATNTLGAGSISVWPSGEPARTAPIISITAAGQTVPNLTIVRVGADGRVIFGTEGGADLVADVVGWTSA